VAQPPEKAARPPAASGGRGRAFPVVRALIVLVAFVVATVLLLGVIHPTSESTVSSSSTATTRPPHSVATTTTTPPSRVPVLVANASDVTGAAAAVSTKLQAGGWDLLPPTNASARVTASNVYYVAGQQQPAEAIAASLKLPASAVVPYTTSAPITSIETAEVLVVVGPDLAAAAGPVTSSTTG
jgi:hypothetical protein